MDDSVDPCEDFYKFACGKFVRETKIPDDQATVDFSTLLDDVLKKQLKDVLSGPTEGTDAEPLKLSKKLYKTCMNQGEREKLIILHYFAKEINYRTNRESRIKANETNNGITWRLARHRK
jgi:predicted metalloendopeptidase